MTDGEDWRKLAEGHARRAVARERRRWIVWALRIIAAIVITAAVAWTLKQL